ncbi:hypothetical protein [Methylobacter sp. S3L5C]|uniref:hypothetical protein n=1 Tax=Methylobacter sp. S3L5C TaxID=2839024 RepID=UPI001FADDB64|nr:hypothetical protein [Methylobacter sp. S3L5C]UOA07315.1 hypothetical protein KKZ03_13590 [Methylobacter sp. S3L5C]
MAKQNRTIKNGFLKEQKIWRFLLTVMALSMISPVLSANMPDSIAMIQQLGIKPQDLASLDQGGIVFFNVAGSSEKELTIGAAMYLLAEPSKIIELIKREDLVSLDTGVLAAGDIPLQATQDVFKGFALRAGSAAAEDFLAATPGSQFNLSTQEFQIIRTISTALPDAASEVYRKILWQRWQSYRKTGLKGIANYDRGDGTEANPAGELQTAALESKVLAHYFPELFKAWLNYPVALPIGVEEAFFWSNREVQGSPTAILVHRVMLSERGGELILTLQFYAGHSFNSNQLVIVCLPYRDGSLVFYENRNFTDQVAGFGSNLKHAIGNSMAQNEISKLLKDLRKSLK